MIAMAPSGRAEACFVRVLLLAIAVGVQCAVCSVHAFFWFHQSFKCNARRLTHDERDRVMIATSKYRGTLARRAFLLLRKLLETVNSQ